MERSEIRVRSSSLYAAPGFRCTQPGLRRNKKKEADRRQTRYSTTRTQAAHRARRGYGGLRRPSASGALACRRSTTALAAATERHRSAPVHALPGDGTKQGRVLSVPCRPSAAGFNPQTGHSAGRAFWPRAAREPKLTRPKPAGTVLAPLHRRHPAVSFTGRDLSLYVAVSETIVNLAVTKYPTFAASRSSRGFTFKFPFQGRGHIEIIDFDNYYMTYEKTRTLE